MRCVLVLVCLFALQASCFPHESRREEEEARILSEVWDAMDKHRGDDIIVVPRHDESGPSEHHSSESHSESHSSEHSEGPHDGPRDGPSHSEPEKLPEPEAHKQSENSESSEKSEESKENSSESKSEGSDRYRPFDKMFGNLDKIGDMMSRAVDRLRQDDQEIKDLEAEGSSSNGLTVFILEIVGGVVVALIVIILVVVGSVKGVNKLKTWRARRESARLVDQENPNMDATGYQSGFNP